VANPAERSDKNGGERSFAPDGDLKTYYEVIFSGAPL
jgi:hypothetical protein